MHGSEMQERRDGVAVGWLEGCEGLREPVHGIRTSVEGVAGLREGCRVGVSGNGWSTTRDDHYEGDKVRGSGSDRVYTVGGIGDEGGRRSGIKSRWETLGQRTTWMR